MTDIQIETVQELPRLTKMYTLTAGQSLTNISEIVTLAQKTVPIGKTAKVLVNIVVLSLV